MRRGIQAKQARKQRAELRRAAQDEAGGTQHATPVVAADPIFTTLSASHSEPTEAMQFRHYCHGLAKWMCSIGLGHLPHENECWE